MELLSKSNLQTLVSNPQTTIENTAKKPHISLYVPKNILEDSMRNDQKSWHALVNKVESFISRNYPGNQTRINSFYKKIKQVVLDKKHTGGVAIFESHFLSGFIPLGGNVQELAIVSDTFHVKPLLNEIQGQNRYYALTLENQSAYLWEGDSTCVEKKALYVMPQDRRTPDPTAIHHLDDDKIGSKQRKALNRNEVRAIMKFYKEVGKRLKRQITHYSDHIYIVGDPALRSLFLNVNRAKNLITHTKLDIDAKRLDSESLYQLVWNLASMDIYRRMRRIAKDYRLYKYSGRSVESLPKIAQLALEGQIEVLLVTKDLHIWGEFDQKNGHIKNASWCQPDLHEDILDDIAEAVVSQGGKVYTLDRKDMPENLDVWGVLRRGRRN